MADPLAALRPLHAPPPVPWWPPAPGWWLLCLTIVVAVAALLWWRRATAARRAALSELQALERSELSMQQKVARLNRLLKRYALVCAPATDTAALTGGAWLDFLDSRGGDGDFTRGPGRILLTVPYGGGEASDMSVLFGLARRWIKNNRERR